MTKGYIPSKGDYVVLAFDPQSGHEQKGRRPALVISGSLFHRHMGLAFVCPITNTDRKLPFHVPVVSDILTGFIMVEQAKSIDFTSRRMRFIEKADTATINRVLSVIESIIL